MPVSGSTSTSTMWAPKAAPQLRACSALADGDRPARLPAAARPARRSVTCRLAVPSSRKTPLRVLDGVRRARPTAARRARLELSDEGPRRLDHGQAGGQGRAAARADVGVAGAVGVADAGPARRSAAGPAPRPPASPGRARARRCPPSPSTRITRAVGVDADRGSSTGAPQLPQKPRPRRARGWARRAAPCSAGAACAASSTSQQPMCAVLAAVDAAACLPCARVPQPELDRVDAELLGQLVDHALAGKGRRASRRARGRGRRLRLVDHDVVAVDLAVRDVVGREDARRAGADHRARDRRPAS